ncbi:DUF1059 domain-containing protein [Fulvimarina sp. MAC3]|uniref:DUF1059 domain-containing protein n=1 Tax=Fulvimarina sp. MAC3 TaxID=3148887 RepID=UPI0031FDBB07
MYELDCTGVIPGCARVIRADTESEVFSRAVMQARRMGYDRIPATMLDGFRQNMIEVSELRVRAAG